MGIGGRRKRFLGWLAIVCLSGSLAWCQPAPTIPDELLTVAEATEYRGTSTSAEVEALLGRLAARSAHVKTIEIGRTGEGRPMTAAIVARDPYALGDQDERIIALVIANIHSGECDGKEAVLRLLRELALNPDHEWLDRLVLVVVPNYNADGNDRMGPNNRPGQIGPELGMGMRENAQHFDLNRDFVKLDAPETRHLVRLMDTINPHLFIDCHTTNGSRHRYGLTYDIPHNPSASAALRHYHAQRMMPAITEGMQSRGWQTFYYGTPDRENRRWQTYGSEPRYSTEYAGLRGRLSILSESYSYISYRERIEVTHAFVSECLDYLHERADEVREVLALVEAEMLEADRREPRWVMALDSRVAAAEGRFTLKAFRDNEPHDYEIELWNEYVPTTTTSLPYAYLIPGDMSRVADRLRMHGIQLDELVEGERLLVEIETITHLRRATQPFQRHWLVQVDTQSRAVAQHVPAGTLVVRTAQPLGRLASYLLEARSNDGLTTWNFLDGRIEEQGDYPIWRLVEPRALALRRVEHIAPRERITLSSIDGPGNLIDDLPKPIKFQPGTNHYVLEHWGRTMLVDPETGAFVRPLRTGRETQDRDRRLIQDALGDRRDRAAAIVGGQRVSSADGSWMVLTDQQDTVLLDGERDRAVAIGTPVAPAHIVSFTPDSRFCLFVRGGALCSVDRQSWDTREIAKRQHDREWVGMLDWVYQEELYGRGNYFGYWVAPDSREVAFLRLDESPVPRVPIVNHLSWHGHLEWMDYPKAGDPLPIVSLHVAGLSSVQPTRAVEFPPDATVDLISRVSWSRDGGRLFVHTQNREQTYLDLWVVPRGQAQAQWLFRDETPAWIESAAPLYDLPDGSYVWLSAREGRQHLYRLSGDGKQLDPLTAGHWQVLDVYGVDPEGVWVYFRGNKFDPLGADVFRVHTATHDVELLTSRSGTHEAEFSADWKYFIDNFSSVEHPVRSVLRRINGEMLRELNIAYDDRLNYLEIQEPQAVQVPVEQFVALDGQLILPPNFDSGRRYPVIVHVYGGPQTPRVRNAFGGKWYLFHQMLAQHGYIVWICDNRSSSLRSAVDAWPIHRQLGAHEMADIEAGLDWLQAQGWVDAERIGIWGWSYGGYMTLYAMTRSPRFRAGIAGAPVTDWRNYDAIYTERFMDTPQNNLEGYDQSSIIRSAGNLRGRLLLIHGAVDDNVHVGNSLQLAHELQTRGKTFQLQIYPASQHGIVDPQQALHLRKTMLEFWLENL